jgi:hypothetical protein
MTEPQTVEAADPSDLDLLVAETAAENGGQTRPDLPDGAVVVPLHDRDGTTVVHEFVILHPDDWPSSANEDPDAQRFYSWALKVLASDDDKNMWRALDPTNRQSRAFVVAWMRAVGRDPKGDTAPNGSSNGGPQKLRAI